MKFGIKLDGFDEMLRQIENVAELAESNLEAAVDDTALEVREILVDETRSPKSGKRVDIGQYWRVVKNGKSVWVINSSEFAAYLEFGTGIYNEGEGLRDYITPRAPRHSAWADRYRAKHGKEPPRVLSWVDPVTKERIFARRVKGMRPVRMVRNNMPEFREILENNVKAAVKATVRGERYA